MSTPVISVTAEPTIDPPPSPKRLTEHPLTKIPIAYSLLIVSRDPAIRKLLCKLLAQPSYHTHQLDDCAQIPSELGTRKVDLLIADLDLPEQQGLEKVSALRNQHPNLRIIALSGLRMDGAPDSVVLTKPFRREALLECVQRALLEASNERQPVI